MSLKYPLRSIMSKEKIPANAIAVNAADRLQYDRRTDPVFFCVYIST